MINENGTSGVTVNKVELLAILRDNRKRHYEMFLRAQEGYRKAVIKQLDQMLANAKEGKPIRLFFSMPEPVNHVKDYDRIIRMLELNVTEQVTISESKFNQYVMDEWSWSEFANSTNSSYLNKE